MGRFSATPTTGSNGSSATPALRERLTTKLWWRSDDTLSGGNFVGQPQDCGIGSAPRRGVRDRAHDVRAAAGTDAAGVGRCGVSLVLRSLGRRHDPRVGGCVGGGN